MIFILSCILLILLLIVGKGRGFKTFISFYLSILLIILYLAFISLGLNAYILAITTCIMATIITLFMINGYNIKTKVSFYAIMIVLAIIFSLIFIISKNANIQGFSMESMEGIGGLSFEINTNMTDILIGMYLVSVIGTIIDTSISVSSSMNEVYLNNPKLNSKELFHSGMNVGKDIMSTTINTLFFALISSFIGLFMYHHNVSFEYIINYKEFAKLVIELLFTFLASIMIIPITSLIASKIFIKKDM